MDHRAACARADGCLRVLAVLHASRVREFDLPVFHMGAPALATDAVPRQASEARTKAGSAVFFDRDAQGHDAACLRFVLRQRNFDEQLLRYGHGLQREHVRNHAFEQVVDGIAGALDLARLEEGITPDLEHQIDFAYDCTKRAADLAAQLILFSKHGALTKEKTDLPALIEENVLFVIKGGQVNVTFHFPEEICTIEIEHNSFARDISLG